jgi:phosphoribosylformylglycinamidine synthase
VLRIKGTDRAVATAIDCPSRYCYLDPELGGRHAVAEATRNVSCAGAKPLAITNCLNFGSPLKPAGYYQLDCAVAGMAAACMALGVPVVSGNVSLYNESGESAVMPTPTVGAVGLIEQADRHATMRWQAGDQVLLIGGLPPTLGGSEFLAFCHGQTAGRPPELDLDLELAVQTVVNESIADGLIRTAHDCTEGGLAVAVAEMAILSGVGAQISDTPPGANGRLDEAWFGEAASRIIVAGDGDSIEQIARTCTERGIPVARLGAVGGEDLIFSSTTRVSLADAGKRFDGALMNLS